MGDSGLREQLGCGSIVNIAFRAVFPPLRFKGELQLPQNDRNRRGRVNELARMHKKYVWTKQGGIGTTPMPTNPPQPEERIRIAWLRRTIGILNKISDNNARVSSVKKVDEQDHIKNEQQLQKVQDTYAHEGKQELDLNEVKDFYDNIASQITKPDAVGVGYKLDEYKDFFQAFALPKVATYEHFLSDEVFSWYRIAGPSPMRLTKLTNFGAKFPDLSPSIMDGIKLFESDSLHEAEEEGRLYYVDYPELSDLDSIPVKPDRFLYAPSAVFAVPKKSAYNQRLMPIAIKCGQDSSYPWYSANIKKTDPVTWSAAKLCVQVTDGLVHETIHHLARTHLLCGIIVCASRRNLSPRHPLFELIVSHSYGTLFINFAASKTLINDGGIIDSIIAPTAAATQQFCADSLSKAHFNFNSAMPDIELENRGVMSSSLPFPYRDDALEIWAALNEWVNSYISSYYRTDDEVVNDVEIQNWGREITADDKGSIGGFGDEGDGKIKTIKYLVRAVSMFIFTASVQHAAVNFPQKPFMSFAPIMPLSGYVPAPKTAKPFKNFDELIEKMMPPLKEAYQIFQTANLLAGVNYTQLGEYNNLDVQKDDIKEALVKFRATLAEMEKRIIARNMKEKENNLPLYAFLRPTFVPESINI